MRTLKNPKGLKLKPCLNCVLSGGSRFTDTYVCPCPNYSGETHRENGKIVSFLCEHRKMHKAPEKGSKDTPEKRTQARLKAIETGKL